MAGGGRVVAKVWWQAPHDDVLDALLHDGEALTFGRHPEVDIRIGYAADFAPVVPRRWGDLTWHRGRLMVTNADDRWGLDLVPTSPDQPRVTVPPQTAVCPAFAAMSLEATAPGFRQVLHVAAAPYDVGPVGEQPGEVPSHVPFALSDAQRRIGRAMLTCLRDGRARRPGYQELASTSNYSVRHVRESLQELDGQLLVHGVSSDVAGSDALDRLADALTRHPGLLQ